MMVEEYQIGQQLNENSKMQLARAFNATDESQRGFTVWRTNVENSGMVITLANKSDFKRNQVRMDINKKVMFQIYIK